MVETLIGIIVTTVIGCFTWLFGLGNRVTRVETQIIDLPELINSKFDVIDGRLDRIERIMNGSLGHKE